MINRRDFLKGLAAGVATVAIATKMAPGMPSGFLPTRGEDINTVYGTQYVWTREQIANSVFDDIGARYHAALLRSMQQSYHHVAMKVWHNVQTGNLDFRHIPADEYYVDG